MIVLSIDGENTQDTFIEKYFSYLKKILTNKFKILIIIETKKNKVEK